MAQKASVFSAKQRQLNEDIKHGSFQRSYLLYGEEAYLRLQNRDKLLKALNCDSSSMNFNRYEGANVSPGEVIDMAETMPFLAERRVILMQDTGLFKEGCPELSAYLKSPSESCVLIFVEKEVDKRKDMYKAAAKAGFEMECTPQDEQTLLKWIAGKFGAEGKRITRKAAVFFIDRVGTDMSNISNEIEKLICYCLDREEITEADIEAVCAGYLVSRIFAMTDAISEQNRKRAMDLYYDLLSLKEPAQKILSLITRQFNIMLQVEEMTKNNRSRQEIASAVGINPYFVTKYQNWARRFSFEQLKSALTLCIDSDDAVKKGKLDQYISVETVIIGCTSLQYS